ETATSRWEKGGGQEGCVVYTKGRCTESTGCQGSARGTRTCRLVLTAVKPLAAPVFFETVSWARRPYQGCRTLQSNTTVHTAAKQWPRYGCERLIVLAETRCWQRARCYPAARERLSPLLPGHKRRRATQNARSRSQR